MSESSARPALAMFEELMKLRSSGVTQKALDSCAQTLRRLQEVPVPEAIGMLEKFAREELLDQGPLVRSLVHHVNGMKVPTDFPKVCHYFQRLALTAGLLGAVVTASERLTPDPSNE